MANIFGNIFNFRSKEEEEKDFKNYFQTMLPYGEAQREKLFQILTELSPKSDPHNLMMHYLLLKEYMMGSESKNYDEISARVAKKKFIRLSPELKDSLGALLDADLQIDEKLQYPTIEELTGNS